VRKDAQVSLRVPVDLLRSLREIAKREGRSLSNTIIHLLKVELGDKLKNVRV